MKRLLIFILLFTSYTTFAQVKVNSEGDIIPTGIYPAVKSTNLKGTIHPFKTITERNALPANFRDTGMIAYVRDSAKYYYLYNGITNADWRDLFKASSALTSGLTSTGDITLVDSTLTINDTIRYTINGVDYIQTIPSTFIVNSADSGYYRKDLIYADATGLYKVVGVPNMDFGVKPKLPINAIEITTVDIYGQQIATPVPVIITPVPNLQQVTNAGNSTTNPIFINSNSIQTPLRVTSDFNRSNYLYFKNRSNGNWANTGFLFKNDISDDAGNEWSGRWFRLMMGSTNSDMIKDGAILMTNGSGGMKIVADSGRITFNSGSPAYPYDTTAHPYKEMGAFETDGSFRLNKYKNNATLDSVLAPDENGLLVMKKLTDSVDVSFLKGDKIDTSHLPVSNIYIQQAGAGETQIVRAADDTTLSVATLKNSTDITISKNADSSAVFNFTVPHYTKSQVDSIAATLTASGITRAELIDTAGNKVNKSDTAAILSGYYNDIASVLGGFRIFNKGSDKSDTVLISTGIDSATLSDSLKRYASYGSLTTTGVLFSNPVSISVTNHFLSGTFTGTNISQYQILGRKASGSGAYSFLTADSTLIPDLHSQLYYDGRYGGGVTVSSYGKNSTLDSTILVLSNGTRYAAKDSVGSGGGSGWALTGNSGITAYLNFLGTTDAKDMRFRVNNTEFMVADSSTGNVGIGTGWGSGTTRPAYKVDVNGDVNVSSGNSYYLQNAINGGVKLGTSAVGANFGLVTLQSTATNGAGALALMPTGTGFSSTIKSEILVANTTSLGSDYLAIRAGGSTDGFSILGNGGRPMWIDNSGNQTQITSSLYFKTSLGGSGIAAPGGVGVNMNNPSAALTLRPGFTVVSGAPLSFSAPVVLTTTAMSGTGSNVTFTFAQPNFVIPFGTTFTVSGATPSGYNGTYSVGSATATSITATGTATGSQTVAGTITISPLLSTPAAYKVENDSSNLYYSDYAATRYKLLKGLTGSATLDFSSTAAQTSSELTITVTGAADGDDAVVSPPNVSSNANSSFSARVSAANTVTVKFNNYSSSAIDPASGSFKVTVIKW